MERNWGRIEVGKAGLRVEVTAGKIIYRNGINNQVK